jgi:hypothetical protein
MAGLCSAAIYGDATSARVFIIKTQSDLSDCDCQILSPVRGGRVVEMKKKRILAPSGAAPATVHQTALCIAMARCRKQQRWSEQSIVNDAETKIPTGRLGGFIPLCLPADLDGGFVQRRHLWRRDECPRVYHKNAIRLSDCDYEKKGFVIPNLFRDLFVSRPPARRS